MKTENLVDSNFIGNVLLVQCKFVSCLALLVHRLSTAIVFTDDDAHTAAIMCFMMCNCDLYNLVLASGEISLHLAAVKTTYVSSQHFLAP